MFLDGLPTYNLRKKIDHPKCTILIKDTIVLDVILQKYVKDLFLDDVICEKCSSDDYESIKSSFTVSIYLKKPHSVLKIIFQRGTYDVTSGDAVKMNLKLLYLLNICTNNHKVTRIYHTP